MEEKLFKLLAGLYRSLFARPGCYRINKLLFDLSARGLGLQNYENDQVSGEQFVLSRILSRYPNPVVLDVGANRGNYAAKVMTAIAGATLYAFEPHPETYRTLAGLADRLKFHAFNLGLGAEPGSLKLYDRPAGGAGTEHASLYREVIEGIHRLPAQEVEVVVTTIDAFLAEQGVERVTLLKIDTEGHEYQVLLGARNLLERGAVDLIQIEFNEMNVVSRVFFRDFHTLLAERYDIYRLLPGGLLPLTKYRPLHCELFTFQNLLFVRKGSQPWR
jgi:FkbM family methyltransferase